MHSDGLPNTNTDNIVDNLRLGNLTFIAPVDEQISHYVHSSLGYSFLTRVLRYRPAANCAAKAAYLATSAFGEGRWQVAPQSFSLQMDSDGLNIFEQLHWSQFSGGKRFRW